jgi:hypothetical protein
MQHSMALEFKKLGININATKMIGINWYYTKSQISMLSGIMVVPLKLDQGECVIPVSNCHPRAMV